MKRIAGILAVAGTVLAFSAGDGVAQAPSSARTIWDGVYTEAQANRGQQAAQKNCGICHTPSEWSSSMFISGWSGRPIRELHSHIRATMPMDQPGRLTAQQYADIVAYMLKLNKVPAGKSELPASDAELAQIRVTRAASR